MGYAWLEVGVVKHRVVDVVVECEALDDHEKMKPVELHQLDVLWVYEVVVDDDAR